MQSHFDFNKIGKREPFTVPEDFFLKLEDKILADTRRRDDYKPASWKVILSSVAAIAAIITMTFSFSWQRSKPVQSNIYSLDDVEQAFARLSDADQEYLLETYQDDVFIQNY